MSKFILSLLLALFCCTAIAEDISIVQGFSSPLNLSEDVATVAIGDPSLFQVVTIKPNLLMLNAQKSGATSLTIFSRSGAILQYRVTITKDIAQLRKLIGMMEKKVSIESIGDLIVLKGSVRSPAALARVLTVADRFVSTEGSPDFSVVSDYGGVLTGNTDEATKVAPVELNAQLNSINIRGGGGNAAPAGLRQPLMDGKGNLAQNIARGNVIMAAKGKVMSLITVDHAPRVEIQMRIVAVDRDKTDRMGIDWRLDSTNTKTGANVLLGSKIGGVVGSLPAPDAKTFNTGTAQLFGLFDKTIGSRVISLSTFLDYVQEKGAGTTLSEPLVTALSGESASFLAGGNVPIPVQSLTPGNATSNAVVTTNITYIPFGLRLIVRPTVLENGKISIVLDQALSEPDYTRPFQYLGAQIPAFSQRVVSTMTESESGETWAVAGLLNEENTKNLKSIPWISNVPVIGWLFKTETNTVKRSELMIMVTARTINDANQSTTSFDGHGDLSPNNSDNQQKPPAPAAPVSEIIIPPSTPVAQPVAKKESRRYYRKEPSFTERMIQISPKKPNSSTSP